MRKYFLILAIFIFTLSSIPAIAQTKQGEGPLTAQDILDEFKEDDKKKEENQEEFEFPQEVKYIKNVIKTDLGVVGSNCAFSYTNAIPNTLKRIPVMWEMALTKYIAVAVNVESLSVSLLPCAAGIEAGVGFFPLGKAPYDLYVDLKAGGFFGALYGFACQCGVGWQFITKSDFTASVGVDFAYYYANNGQSYLDPAISVALGWGF